MKTGQLITILVNRYIGVEGGYLGDFTYRTHSDFYREYCGLDKEPNAFDGTTRERFIAIFEASTPVEQGKIIFGALERFPHDEGPKTRTAELAEKLATEAQRLLDSKLVSDPSLSTNSEMVHETLADAKSLIEHREARSAVDRVHTAFHGYLRTQCTAAGIPYEEKDDLVKLVKRLFEGQPKLAIAVKSSEVQNIVRSLVSISDSLNPIRNQGSRAHPNETLIGEPEAYLVVNSIYSVLSYLESKLSG